MLEPENWIDLERMVERGDTDALSTHHSSLPSTAFAAFVAAPLAPHQMAVCLVLYNHADIRHWHCLRSSSFTFSMLNDDRSFRRTVSYEVLSVDWPHIILYLALDLDECWIGVMSISECFWCVRIFSLRALWFIRYIRVQVIFHSKFWDQARRHGWRRICTDLDTETAGNYFIFKFLKTDVALRKEKKWWTLLTYLFRWYHNAQQHNGTIFNPIVFSRKS